MQTRQAKPEDVPTMVELACQLGYSIEPEEFAERLAAYDGSEDHVALVTVKDGRVVGFANGGKRLDLVYPATVELESLVITEGALSRGVGKALLAEFEQWAKQSGATYVKLGSRDSRADAHRFYLREGYEFEKVHHIYRKRLT